MQNSSKGIKGISVVDFSHSLAGLTGAVPWDRENTVKNSTRSSHAITQKSTVSLNVALY